MAAVAHLKSYKRGEVIFHEGGAADAFLTIISGRVTVFKTTLSGREIILEIFGAGDPLGAVAVYENAPLPASALALNDTSCLAIARQEFFRLPEEHPAAGPWAALGDDPAPCRVDAPPRRNGRNTR